MKITDIINLDRYPIVDPDSPVIENLRSQCRQDLKQNLYCTIPDFISPPALEQMTSEASALLGGAYHNNARRNCYLHRQIDSELPDDHPRNMQDRSSVRMIAYDQLSNTSPLKVFYQAPAVRQLIADIIGEPTLYLCEDPYQPANYVCYQAGDESSWHFDEDNSFTMTLMVQAAQEGGEFEISPNTRSETDENYEGVRRVLTGSNQEKVVSISRGAGELCVFRGCHSLHRVTPVAGHTPRIMGVFVYENRPGVCGDPLVNETIYGPRTTLN